MTTMKAQQCWYQNCSFWAGGLMNISLFTRRLRLNVLLACTLVVTGWAGGVSGAADKTAKLSGCLIRGEGDGAGYLLANSPTEPWLNSPGRQITPSALGTSGDYATIFYWLDGNGDLKQHIGHRVEVEGDLKGDVKDGEIETDRKDNWTDLTVKADGRTMKVHVPNMSIFPASNRDKDRKSDILVRRVDVKHVRMVSASCN
jgi:hypothetical protein